MRRYLAVAILLFITVPFGASVVGCSKGASVRYCTNSVTGASGPQAGQTAKIALAENFATYGESLDYGQIGSSLSATATDCFGSTVSVSRYTYATSDMTFADINPSTGQVCAGTWNRNSGGGVGDYTTCTAPTNAPANAVAYVTATADGVVSNAIAVYVHPRVTAIVLGSPSTNCSTDPSTSCCPVLTGTVVTAPAYTATSCLSQGASAQVVARVYKNGTTNPADNITCQVGHLQFAAQTSSIVTFDQNGVATAQQPGSTIVTASVSNSSAAGAAGFFSTCPPASITLSASGQSSTNGPITVGLNNSQALTSVVKDTNGVTLTGVSLQFNSTNPTAIPGSSSVTPQFPATATITAVCQPPACNPAPYSQIGLYGNGKPITSNGIQITSPGTNTTVLYVGSTQSQYVLPVDFSTGSVGTPVKLAYTPNSMVISQDGSTVYLGSSSALMVLSTANNAVSSTYTNIMGTALAVSPDGASVVVTDPTRQTVSLVSNSGTVTSQYNGVGTRAQWTPDSQTVYITAGNQLLVHSSFTGWTAIPLTFNYSDVAVTVPHVGAFFAGPLTEARSYCPSTTGSTAANPPVETNTFFPVSNDTSVATDRVTATTDGKHILGATTAALSDIGYTYPKNTVNGITSPAACPTTVPTNYFSTTPAALLPFTGITATAINNVVAASNSALAFVTFTGSGGQLPEYVPAGSGAGALNYVQLSGSASAPVSGVFATDNKTFYTGTSGDNLVHLITINGVTATDSSTIAPKLPDGSGNFAVPNLLVQHPKKSTS